MINIIHTPDLKQLFAKLRMYTKTAKFHRCFREFCDKHKD